MIRSQRGNSTVEVLIGVAILGLLTPVIGSLIHQGLTTPIKTVRALQASAGTGGTFLWLSRDITQAQDSNLADGGAEVSSATFTWTDYYGSAQTTSHSLAYSLSGTNLQRTLDGGTSTIGRNITSLSFTRAGSSVSVSVTASPVSGVTDTKSIKLYLRANA